MSAFDDAAERTRRGLGRPSKVDAYRERAAQILQAEPEVPALEVLRRLREDGYRGGQSAVYDLVAALRPIASKPLVSGPSPSLRWTSEFAARNICFSERSPVQTPSGSVRERRFGASNTKTVSELATRRSRHASSTLHGLVYLPALLRLFLGSTPERNRSTKQESLANI